MVFDLQRVLKVVKRANACKRRNLSTLLRTPYSNEKDFSLKILYKSLAEQTDEFPHERVR